MLQTTTARRASGLLEQCDAREAGLAWLLKWKIYRLDSVIADVRRLTYFDFHQRPEVGFIS